MKVLIIGSDGFLGRNLKVRLKEKNIETIDFTRCTPIEQLPEILTSVDFIFHLAGVNRPKDPDEFVKGNYKLTNLICDAVRRSGRKIPILFSSSVHAESKSEYGRSKLSAERLLTKFESDTASPVYMYRLANVFGKWSKPNYNSVVATFCYNIANDIDIEIHDPEARLQLVYIDDVISHFIEQLSKSPNGLHRLDVEPTYSLTIQTLAEMLFEFKVNRQNLIVDGVGKGLVRALYATYLSYLKPIQFSYELPEYKDQRGSFVELLKTGDSGQFSFFTAHPGITRGKHYHHTKNEKFLVVRGTAYFRFKNILTNEVFEKYTSDDKLEVVETVPGWAHEVTNVGKDEMLVFVWANEVFDRAMPDTIPIMDMKK